MTFGAYYYAEPEGADGLGEAPRGAGRDVRPAGEETESNDG